MEGFNGTLRVIQETLPAKMAAVPLKLDLVKNLENNVVFLTRKVFISVNVFIDSYKPKSYLIAEKDFKDTLVSGIVIFV